MKEFTRVYKKQINEPVNLCLTFLDDMITTGISLNYEPCSQNKLGKL